MQPSKEKKTSQRRSVNQILEAMERTEGKNSEQYIEAVQEGLTLSRNQKNRILILKFLHDLGMALFKAGKFKEAKKYYAEGQELSRQEGDIQMLIKFKTRLAAIQITKGNMQQAIDYLFEVLEQDAPEFSSEAYNNLSYIYRSQGDYEKANFYLEKALITNKEKKFLKQIGFNYFNAGLIFFDQEFYKEALQEFNNSYVQARRHSFPYVEALSLMQSGRLFSEVDYFKEARRFFTECLLITERLGYHFLTTSAMFHLSETYTISGEYEQALRLSKEVEQMAEDASFGQIRLKALGQTQAILKLQGKHKESNKYLEKITEAHSSILSEETDEVKKLLMQKEKELQFLIAKNRAMRQQNDDMRQYMHVLAHDIKEPLRSIGGFTDLLKRNYTDDLDNKAQEYMKFIMGSTQQMDDILTDLLKYISLESSKVSTFDVMDALNMSKQAIELKIKDAKAKIVVANPLPTITGIKHQVVELFTHLLDNAIKFRSKKRPTITLTYELQGEKHLFALEDNGIGIADDYHEIIFRIFNRLEKNMPGTGIGLAMAKKIVQFHGGKIWVDSEPGKGSTFYFTLNSL